MSNDISNKPMYNGEPGTGFTDFITLFKRYAGTKGVDADRLFAHKKCLSEYKKQLAKIKNLPESQDNAHLDALARDKYQKDFEKADEIHSKLHKDYLTIKSHLESCLSESVHDDIAADRFERLKKIKAKDNYFKIESYAGFQALYETLLKCFAPSGAALYGESLSQVLSMPSTATVVEIVAAVKKHVRIVTDIIRTDEDGNEVLDEEDMPIHMEIDKDTIRSFLVRCIVSDCKAPLKTGIFHDYTKNVHVGYDTLFQWYKDVAKQTVNVEKSSTGQALPTNVSSKVPNNTAPNFANAAVSQQNIVVCENCEAEGHIALHCPVPTCKICGRTFHKWQDRRQHFFDEHHHDSSRGRYDGNYRSRGNDRSYYPRRNDNYRNRGSNYHYNDNGRSRNRSSSHSRQERSRSRDRPSSSNNRRSREQSRDRSHSQDSRGSSRNNRRPSTPIRANNATVGNNDRYRSQH